MARIRLAPVLRAGFARLCRPLFAAALLLLGGAAVAADFSVGVAGGVDRGRVTCVAAFACDSHSTFGKIFVTYQLDNAFELQALYFDAGHFKGGDTTSLGTEFGGTFKVSGFGLTAGYRWHLADDWSIAARAGAAGVRTRFDYADPFSGSTSKNLVEPFVGLAIDYAITPAIRVGLGYDWTRFKVYTTQGSLQMLGLAAQYSF